MREGAVKEGRREEWKAVAVAETLHFTSLVTLTDV
jgi:hypothetical protein